MTTRGTNIKVRTTKQSPKTKMKKRATAASTAARKKTLTTSRARTAVNVLTRQMGLMSIPKTIETRGVIMGSEQNNTLKLRLTKPLMTKLKDIYKMSENQRIEFAGLIECTFDTNYANFGSPTARTNYQMTSVYFPRRTRLTKMMYHTHPLPMATQGSKYMSIPSGPDFVSYVQAHRGGIIEANLILEQQGVYVIDVLRPTTNATGVDMHNTIMKELQTARGFEYTVQDIILVFNIDIEKWKKFVNNTLDPILNRKHGVSMKFYKWSELPITRVSALPQSTGASP